MTYIGTLIQKIIRPETGNTSYAVDSTTGDTVEGISQDLVVSFINDALAFLQSRIIAVYPSEFVEESIQNTVVDQEEYTITDNIFLNNKFISVEFSRDGNLDSYYPLPPASLHQRNTRSGIPFQYIRRNGALLLNYIPKITSHKLRVNYYRALDKLDIRRGTISSKSSTSIVLANDSVLDAFALADAQYVCTVSSLGVVKDYNIPITSYTSSTRTLAFASQTVNAAANDYVVVGKYTTTHLPADKPQRMLDFCKVFAQAKIQNMDSSTDAIMKIKEVKDVLDDIIDQFSEMTEDITDVPTLDEALT